MVAFFPDFCVFQDLYTGQVKGIGKEDRGLYILTRGPNQAPKSMSFRSHSHSTSVAKSIVLPSLHSISICESADVWHKRLGHAPIDIIKRHKSLSALSSKDNSHCTVCPLAKHNKLPFPLNTTLSKGVFELLHCDIWGPYKVPTYNGKRFFVTIVDDYSRYTWLFLLASKADTIVVLRKFLTQVKNVFSTTVKTLRTDNGCEFLSHDFQSMLGELGIVHQTTCVYTPQQNGVAERKHRTILNMARSIRFQAFIPLQYWGECVSTSVYILNRLPSRVLGFQSSFERLYMHPPSLSHLRVFGCLCYAACPKVLDKFSPRAIPAVLMGYSSTQKGYILYDFHGHAFFVSRNVVFQEHLFPFKHAQEASNPMFPVLDLVPRDDGPSVISGASASPTQQVPEMPALLTDGSAGSPIHVPTAPLPLFVIPDESTRRSTRTSRPPIWLQDFITQPRGNTCLYPLADQLTYSKLSESYQQVLKAYSAVCEPVSYKDAASDPAWVKAMQLEIDALQSNKTWSIVDLPPGKKPIGCRWIYKVKYLSSGEVERFKARLVAKGFSQREGLDYGETFSPVAKMVTVRSIVALTASKGWHIFQMDVHNAFLNGDLLEEVYMDIPCDFSSQGESHKVCKLHKSLYGLKQAPRQWNVKVTEALVAMGFKQSHYDYSLFTKLADKIGWK